MSASTPQGQRSGEGTAGLWHHIQDDDRRKEKEPGNHGDHDGRQQYSGESEQQPSRSQG